MKVTSLTIIFTVIFLLGKTKEKPLFDVNETLNEKVSLWQGDITSLEVDAIVNAGKMGVVTNCQWQIST